MTIYAPQESASWLAKLRLAALDAARCDLGSGEAEGSNNKGPFIRLIKYPRSDGGAWCASAVSYWYELAALGLGIRLPFMPKSRKTWHRKRHSALWLYRRIGKRGLFIGARDTPKPGDVICWRRGRSSWMGHIAIVERYAEGVAHIIEGNRGPYPALVQRRIVDMGREPKLLGCATV